MAYADASHRVFKVSELARTIAAHLAPVSNKSAVNFARVCRYLEEPILSAVWRTQVSFRALLSVLPEELLEWHAQGLYCSLRIVRNPSEDAWARVRRYASWIRQGEVGCFALEAETLQLLLLNTPPGGWFPAMRDLSWSIEEANLPYAHIFFSPQLKEITVFGNWPGDSTAPDLSAAGSAISELPTSGLQSLSLTLYLHGELCPSFDRPLRSAVLNCGPLLTRFTATTPLSDEVVNHILQLPHLNAVRIVDPPPPYPSASFPLFLPPLTDFSLGEDGALEWISLFILLEGGVYAARRVTPLSKIKKSLDFLRICMPPGSKIDASFTVTRIFRNLTCLDVDHHCDERVEGLCDFELNDSDITELAMALPQLHTLALGHPCSANTCATTVACLLQISARCPELDELCIHFNTANILNDLENTLKDPQFQELRSLPRCPLSCLYAHDIPLSIDNESDFETVQNGIADVFPCLDRCNGSEEIWQTVGLRIAAARVRLNAPGLSLTAELEPTL